MIYSKLKEYEEIKKGLAGAENVFLLGCGGCAEVCSTGGIETLLSVKELFEKENKKVTGYAAVEFLCSKTLIIKSLRPRLDLVLNSSAVLVFSCGIGVQCAAAALKRRVFPATNTTYLGGFQGTWPGEERCAECGTCYLGFTGGICPVTACAKELVNGACGGAKNGKCEIKTGKDCGWVLIHDRLKEIGRFDLLKEYQAPRDFLKMEPDDTLRKTVHFAIDKKTEK